MARGGKREGAGRKPGSLSKRTQEIAEALAGDGGLTPLEYLTSIYRDPKADDARRIDAAKAAAPYVHPRLNSIEHKGDADNPVELITRIELVDGDSED